MGNPNFGFITFEQKHPEEHSESVQQSGNDAGIDYTKLTKVRLPFIENLGQVDQEVKFYANTFAGSVFVTENGLTHTFINQSPQDGRSSGVAVVERFVPLNEHGLRPTGVDKSETMVNYFVGQKENWRSNLPTYNSVDLGDVWSSIDVELRPYGKNIEKIFKVAPGGSVEDIRLSLEGIRSLGVDQADELLLETDLGTIKMTKPFAYQNIGGMVKPVEVRYLVKVLNAVDRDQGANNDPRYSYGFAVGEYDPGHTLVIDPLLASTFIGGSDLDEGNGIALDSSDNVFVTGRTIDAATDYPTTAGAYDETHNGSFDVFVSKLNNDLTSLLASTFIGEISSDEARGIAIDSSDKVFVTGFTEDAATDYPTTAGAYDETHNGMVDVLVSELTNDLDVDSAPPPPSTTLFCGKTIDQFANVIEGTENDDILVGTAVGELIRGLGGNDTITGKGGPDCLIGGDGNDAIYGLSGNDMIEGNEGNDNLFGGRGEDVIAGGLGDDIIKGNRGNDTIDGGDGNDVCKGGLGSNTKINCEQ